MMGQPTNSNEDSNAAILASKSPDPAHVPQSRGVDIEGVGNDSTTIDIVINEGSTNSAIPEEDNKRRSKKSVRWSQELVKESPVPLRDPDRGPSNPNVNYSAAPSPNPSSFNFKETMGGVKDVLGRWGKKVGEATRKAEDLAGKLGNTGTKVLAEGGYEKIFRRTFETVLDEHLKNSFAYNLSTSAGPVMGVLYVSTAKLAFCSDNPLPYQAGDKTKWSYYKVVVPLHQLKAVHPSTSRTKSAEKYIQVISNDGHEFWYMGFLNYGEAVTFLQDAARDM